MAPWIGAYNVSSSMRHKRGGGVSRRCSTSDSLVPFRINHVQNTFPAGNSQGILPKQAPGVDPPLLGSRHLTDHDTRARVWMARAGTYEGRWTALQVQITAMQPCPRKLPCSTALMPLTCGMQTTSKPCGQRPASGSQLNGTQALGRAMWLSAIQDLCGL